jgi:hypothetical protein
VSFYFLQIPTIRDHKGLERGWLGESPGGSQQLGKGHVANEEKQKTKFRCVWVRREKEREREGSAEARGSLQDVKKQERCPASGLPQAPGPGPRAPHAAQGARALPGGYRLPLPGEVAGRGPAAVARVRRGPRFPALTRAKTRRRDSGVTAQLRLPCGQRIPSEPGGGFRHRGAPLGPQPRHRS